jgi:hypothetical protein
VAYAFIHDVASSWTEYEQAAAALVNPRPRGLLAHVAGPTDEGVRIIEIWDDEDTAARFRRERLTPVIALLTNASSQRSAMRDLHAVHLLLAGSTPHVEGNSS